MVDSAEADPRYLSCDCRSWSEARSHLLRFDEQWVYRGVASARWELQTSLERSFAGIPSGRAARVADVHRHLPRAVAESFMLKEFKRRAHHFLQPGHLPDATLEWLAMMQHYGAPTRFLDWTRSPFVAAYFALESTDPDGTCAIWCLNESWCKQRTRMRMQAVDASLSLRFDLSDPKLFDEQILLGGHKLVVPIEPFRLHDRMTTQQGLFLCPGDVEVSFMENLEVLGDKLRLNLTQLRLPLSVRVDGLKELDKMNINRATLFPGLDGLARSLKYRLIDPTMFSKINNDVGQRWRDEEDELC